MTSQIGLQQRERLRQTGQPDICNKDQQFDSSLTSPAFTTNRYLVISGPRAFRPPVVVNTPWRRHSRIAATSRPPLPSSICCSRPRCYLRFCHVANFRARCGSASSGTNYRLLAKTLYIVRSDLACFLPCLNRPDPHHNGDRWEFVPTADGPF